jgi:protein tyrosine phosphatase
MVFDSTYRDIPNRASLLQLKVKSVAIMTTPAARVCIGPKQHMLIDFWRLVWQERPPTIVMVTNLKEGNKKKCEQYWPDTGSLSYGPFKVTLTAQQVIANCTTRTMLVTVS